MRHLNVTAQRPFSGQSGQPGTCSYSASSASWSSSTRARCSPAPRQRQVGHARYHCGGPESPAQIGRAAGSVDGNLDGNERVQRHPGTITRDQRRLPRRSRSGQCPKLRIKRLQVRILLSAPQARGPLPETVRGLCRWFDGNDLLALRQTAARSTPAPPSALPVEPSRRGRCLARSGSGRCAAPRRHAETACRCRFIASSPRYSEPAGTIGGRAVCRPMRSRGREKAFRNG